MVDKKKTGQEQVAKYFEIKGDDLIRKKRDCPRCGKGVYMGQHSNRSTCGKCGFTEFSHNEKAKKPSK
ncbi:MAG TPA: 30S ribosomal protein S27ae [Nitrososphaeraceae archaeon]|jgi:small subunit ribosomal protein S27Ae